MGEYEGSCGQATLVSMGLPDFWILLGVYVCRGSISRIEECSRTVTDIELFAIAEALGVDLKELYCG